MLTYGGREAQNYEREAAIDFISRFGEPSEALRFPEIAILETDGYGRVMVFLRVLHADGQEEPLLIAFKEIRSDGGYLAGPKSILRVRAASFYAGLEHHKVRNSWDCPPDANPSAEL
ncbi:hypothetical protein SDC9_141979 [bioreactor metagenome]|uniref:Uncharacterized protein n=1 Tax=bioreactor metagenome TaxID=1076179 RepID=A0A645DZV6_9ZZZZ|nr:hypothetical protein [Christensenella sp.]